MNSRKKTLGFTLVEVLVALLVLSIGLLGLAGLELTGLRNNQSALQRSQATVIADNIADRMRANRPAVIAGSYRVNPAAPPATPAWNCENDFNGTASGVDCAPAEMAQLDATQWYEELRDVLPGGQASVICADSDITDLAPCTAGSIHTLTVMWDDQRTGVTGTACGGDPTVDLTCFTTSFQP
jgi:type IV pilus modification protein PilV